MNLPKNIPKDLSSLLEAMATDFPAILHGNLVGIYVWGSLTYDAFDETCSDFDSVEVTRRHLGDREFSELDGWFKTKAEQNHWVKRIDMRFVIDREFLDKASRCCGFYHHTGRLTRHHRALASKDEAYGWAMGTVPPVWRAVIHAAKENRLRNAGSTAPQLEEDAKQFVEFVSGEVNRILAIPQQLNHLK